ncbi:hypothetical protein G293_05005 [Candidatus Liberibacter africanus PTSAPSY]|uniref:Uncharacterized protein n=1 Tax=Candidatus Liberibacter africanus PTSAPSY TaxID=1277257 RepID=A0A0G3I400_LIBAF|nr:hypothetical protein G293_05005 [Candidatus Liberibacter africanus PTSAPSY]
MCFSSFIATFIYSLINSYGRLIDTFIGIMDSLMDRFEKIGQYCFEKLRKLKKPPTKIIFKKDKILRNRRRKR